MIGLLISLGVLVLYYIGMPVLARFVQVYKARPTLQSLSSSELPAVLSEYMHSNASALHDIGFVPEAYVSAPDILTTAQAYLIMLTRRTSGDKAMVTLMTTSLGSQTPQVFARYVEFETRLLS